MTKLPELPSSDIPGQWQVSNDGQALSWPQLDWWSSFSSSELTKFMALVETSNLDLANNVRNLEQAQLSLRNAGFDLLPTPLMEVGADRRYIGFESDDGSFTNTNSTRSELSTSLVYTDILSKPARYDAAVARYDGDIARLADLRLNTLGTAASTYFQILLIRDRIEAAEQNLENAEAIYRIIQARANAGTVTPIDALQQRIAVQQQQNNLKTLHQNELSVRASLATLIASSVNDVQVRETTLQGVTVPAVQPGLPSELLLRRPDLVSAEADLRLFRANVDLTRLEFLPNISLTASAGAASTSLDGLLDNGITTATGTASFLLTLLDNGARNRNLKNSKLDLESALDNYRKAAITAFNDIEVSLGNIALLESLSIVAGEDLTRAEEAYRIAGVRYREGVSDYQTVLNTQNTLFSVRNAFLDNKLARLNAIISFYQALGGGWQRQT
ncbi:MAG: TolC family protein [Arenicellaceae bacterium]|nr:TolC family protein [Arenicellaceae bacterium]